MTFITSSRGQTRQALRMLAAGALLVLAAVGLPAQAQGGGPEPHQSGGVHAQDGGQGGGLALLHAGGDGEDVGRAGRHRHHGHDAEKSQVQMRIDRKRGHKALSGASGFRSSRV